MSIEQLNKIDTIILDLDGTLTHDICWFRMTKELGADVKEHARLLVEFRQRKLSLPVFTRKLLGLWQATGNDNYHFIDTMFRSWQLREDVEHTISHLKKQVRRLCIISGAPSMYVEIVAEKLGIEFWYANANFWFDQYGRLIDFDYEPNEADHKVVQYKEYAKKENLRWDQCAIVGDGESDFGLFQFLLGIAINAQPNEKLELLAFKVIKEFGELVDLFKFSRN